MSQIEDLQSRITRALDRIAQGIDSFAPVAAPEDMEALRLRAEAAENTLAETQESLEATREQAKLDIDAAVQATRAEAAEEIERLAAEARAAPVDDTQQDSADTIALREALEDEKIANAQLEERVRVLKQRLADAPTAAPVPPPSRDTLAELDQELGRLRAANEQLLTSNAALREANAQSVGEPELINESLKSELEALQAARAVDAAEAEAVLGALTPLLAEAAGEGSR
jgi:hypothetical protein